MHITLIGVPLPKIDQKPIENRSEIDPKSSQNRPKIVPEWGSENELDFSTVFKGSKSGTSNPDPGSAGRRGGVGEGF